MSHRFDDMLPTRRVGHKAGELHLVMESVVDEEVEEQDDHEEEKKVGGAWLMGIVGVRDGSNGRSQTDVRHPALHQFRSVRRFVLHHC